MSRSKRLPLKKGEWLLLFSPLAIFVILGVWRLRQPAKIEHSNVAPISITNAWFAGNTPFILGQGTTQGAKAPQVFVWNRKTGELVSQSPLPLGTSQCLPSPNGGYYAGQDGQGIWVRDITTHTLGVRWPTGSAENLTWTPDSQYLISNGASPTLYDVFGGTAPRPLGLKWLTTPNAKGGLSQAVFSPDGTKVAWVENIDLSVATYSPVSSTPSSQTTTSVIVNSYIGGRVKVTSWPAMQPLFELPGDLFNAVEWTHSGDLVAIANIMDGNETLQTRLFCGSTKAVKSRIITGQWRDIEIGGRFSGLSHVVTLVPGGQWLLTQGTSNGNACVFVWNTMNGRLAGQISLKSNGFGPGFGANYSRDGSEVVQTTGNSFKIVPFKTLIKSPSSTP